VVLSAAVLIAAGCRWREDSLRPPMDPPVIKGRRLQPIRNVPKDQNPRDFIILVRLRLMTIRVPIGSVSESEQLWSYLDEEPANARVGPSLSCNGIRIGVGRKEAWDNIIGILQRQTGQRRTRSVAQAPPGTPMPVIFKAARGTQTIFTYRRDNTLVGNDYPPGENVMMMAATVDYDDLDAVQLSGSLVVRSKRRSGNYIKKPGGYAFVSKNIHHRLVDMGFRFRIPRGDFLLIGPGQEVQRKSSPGRHFLVHEDRAVEFETVVIIAPEVFAAPIRKPDRLH